MAPFISNAEAAATTCRQVADVAAYAIRRPSPSSDRDRRVVLADLLRRQFRAFNKMKVGGTKDFDIVQADGFWPRLYFRQGPDPGRRLRQAAEHRQRLPGSCRQRFPAAGRQRPARPWVAAPELLGRLRHHGQYQPGGAEDIGSIGLLLDEVQGASVVECAVRENIALMGILAATNLGTISAPRDDGNPFNPIT